MCFIARLHVSRVHARSRRAAQRTAATARRRASGRCPPARRRRRRLPQQQQQAPMHRCPPPKAKKIPPPRQKTLPQHRRLVLNGEGREDVRVHRDRRARGAQGHRGRRQRREQGAGHGVANFLFLLTRSNEIGRIHVDFRKANMTGTRAGPWLWLLYCCVPVGTRGGIGRLGCGPVAVRRALARGWR